MYNIFEKKFTFSYIRVDNNLASRLDGYLKMINNSMYGIVGNYGIPSEHLNSPQMERYVDTLALEGHIRQLRESIETGAREQFIVIAKNLGKWNIDIPDKKFSNFSRPLSFSK